MLLIWMHLSLCWLAWGHSCGLCRLFAGGFSCFGKIWLTWAHLSIFPQKVFWCRLSLDCSTPTCMICSFAWARIARQCFRLLSLGNQWTPVLAFWVEEKVSDLINRLDRKHFVWKNYYSTKFLKVFVVSLLFGTLNNHNCMAQPAFVPGGKDFVPQNCLFLFLKLQPLLAMPLWTFCCQAELGPETQSSVIQHLIDTLEHKTRLCWLLDGPQT